MNLNKASGKSLIINDDRDNARVEARNRENRYNERSVSYYEEGERCYIWVLEKYALMISPTS